MAITQLGSVNKFIRKGLYQLSRNSEILRKIIVTADSKVIVTSDSKIILTRR